MFPVSAAVAAWKRCVMKRTHYFLAAIFWGDKLNLKWICITLLTGAIYYTSICTKSIRQIWISFWKNLGNLVPHARVGTSLCINLHQVTGISCGSWYFWLTPILQECFIWIMITDHVCLESDCSSWFNQLGSVNVSRITGNIQRVRFLLHQQ